MSLAAEFGSEMARTRGFEMVCYCVYKLQIINNNKICQYFRFYLVIRLYNYKLHVSDK